jgi:hypothetical protein
MEPICKCGHAKSFHKGGYPPEGFEWCEGNGKRVVDSTGITKNHPCKCKFFRMDNLSIIEQEAMRRKLI